MKKYITLAVAGLFLFSLQPARAQRQVEPPAVPPMLEGQKPLAQPETTREPTPPKAAETGKAKPTAKAKSKAKAGKKGSQQAATKAKSPHKAPKEVKKKGAKNPRKKQPETGAKRHSSPVAS